MTLPFQKYPNEISEKIYASKLAEPIGYDEAIEFLEEAHVLAQPYAWPHFWVHWKMFLLAYRFGVYSESVGQIPRLVLAIPGTLSGRLPKGNVGSTKMRIFEER